jgi:hypothetical protein
MTANLKGCVQSPDVGGHALVIMPMSRFLAESNTFATRKLHLGAAVIYLFPFTTAPMRN